MERPPTSGSRRSSAVATAAVTNHNADATLNEPARMGVGVGTSPLHDALQTSLPPSSPVANSPRPADGRNPASNTPLRRSSSALSLKSERGGSSPSIMRKTSMSSLRGDVPPTPTRPIIRKSSSQLFGASSLAPAVEEPPVTENSVAEDWFRQELEKHESSEPSVSTIVILHEACYGHRFARPKTTKGTLSLIVERPERIEASTMGISAAYVRLGERHNDGQHGPDPRAKPPPHLPFRIKRTSRTLPITSLAATSVHGTNWMEELKVMCEATSQKLATTGRETERPADLARKDKPAFHSGDLYLCSESLAAFEGALGSVCDGVDAVFKGVASGDGPSQAFVCVRPPGHHCSADFPSGFCWLNNVHVGIQYAVKEHALTHAAIIDFDLHHGDGSQAITWAHNQKVASMPKNTHALKKTAIGYYSIHDINSYPCENGEPEKILNASICIENAHNQSIWNVHLQPWKTIDEFWDLYETKYRIVLDKARVFLKHHTARLRASPHLPKPRGAIFISAGFDASEHEGAGMQRHDVNVPTEFYARFTKDIVALAQEDGTGVDGRVISVLEGGYSDKALISGVLSHVSGLCHGHEVVTTRRQGVTNELAERMAKLNVAGLSGLPVEGQLVKFDDAPSQLRYNHEWWRSELLDALVEILNPSGKMPAFEAARDTRTSTFASPTQASKMKQINVSQRRSSGHVYRSQASCAGINLPPPTVHWTVAAQELCKLLIPTSRTTKSHTAAELAAPKVKKQRASNDGLATVSAASLASGRQLREKRTAASKPTPSAHELVANRVVSDRRRTIAANEILPDARTEAGSHVLSLPKATRVSRRSSIASTAADGIAAPAVAIPASRPQSVATARPGTSSSVVVKKTRGPAAPRSANTVNGANKIPSNPDSAAPAHTYVKYASDRSGSRSTSEGLDSLVAKTQRLKINMPSNDAYTARRAKTSLPASATQTSKAIASEKVGQAQKTASSATAAKKTSPTAAKAKSPTKSPNSADIPGLSSFQIQVHPSGVLGSSAAPEGIEAMTGEFQVRTSPPSSENKQENPITPTESFSLPTSDTDWPLSNTNNIVSDAVVVENYDTAQAAAPSLASKSDFVAPTSPAVPNPQNAPPLPSWSSTGFIPFAAAPAPGSQIPLLDASQNPLLGASLFVQPGTPTAERVAAAEATDRAENHEVQSGRRDIWEVPVSP